jgi:hypothetical protein
MGFPEKASGSSLTIIPAATLHRAMFGDHYAPGLARNVARSLVQRRVIGQLLTPLFLTTIAA